MSNVNTILTGALGGQQLPPRLLQVHRVPEDLGAARRRRRVQQDRLLWAVPPEDEEPPPHGTDPPCRLCLPRFRRGRCSVRKFDLGLLFFLLTLSFIGQHVWFVLVYENWIKTRRSCIFEWLYLLDKCSDVSTKIPCNVEGKHLL